MRFPAIFAAALPLALAACLGDSTVPGCQQVPTLVSETRGDTVVTITGLRYLETRVGTGAVARSCEPATVNYVGTLTDGTQFDAGTFSLVPGRGGAIAGFEQGVVGMRLGGQRRLIIPPGLGYGSRGQGPIPPNSTLIFDLELVAAGS